jgi:hypothetical protein
VEKFEGLLIALAARRDAHARFLNTLSMLEYMGARKILKSQRAEEISFEILSHAAEEIRHAQALKRIALKLGDGRPETYSDEHLLSGPEARRYFQAIDHLPGMEGEQLSPSQSYALTTLLIEERAIRVYPIYERVLAAVGFPGVLKGILQEEDRHLAEIREALTGSRGLSAERVARARTIEEQAFGRWERAIEAELSLDQI